MPPKKPLATGATRTPAKPAAKPAAGRGAPAARRPGAAAKPAGGAKPVAGAKKGAPTSKGKTGAGKDAPAAKKWTKEDEAARKIQTSARGYIARKQLQKRKKEKQNYEEMIERLEKEAFVAFVKMQQEELERQRQKEEEERRRRREDAKRRKRMLEAAFDGDEEEIKAVLKEVEKCDDELGIGHDVIGMAKRKRHQLDMIDCEDANGNTPLSEAAGGGSASVIKMLFDLGANPNSQGHFKRTPLYRAAFAGHLEAVQVLLSYGSDPRIYADDGSTPGQVASLQAVKECLESWDVEQTDMLLEKLDELKQQRNEEERIRREAEVSEMEGKIKDTEKEYQVKHKQLVKAQEELEKRIREHDLAIADGFENKALLEQVIHDAETGLEMARVDADKVQQKLMELRMEMRECNVGDETLPGVKANIKELDEVLMRDVGNKIGDSGKWPLLIDGTQKASTFLRYQDTNYINALNPRSMEKDRVRMALVGALRFGKMVVLDLMSVDVFDVCIMRFDEVQEGLMKAVMDKSIMQEKKYSTLIQEADGEDYQLNKFNQQRVQNFRFVLVTQVPFPPEDLLEKCYPISVIVT